MAKESRPQRWNKAVKEITTILDGMANQLDNLDSAAAELKGVQEEYEEWKDNLPENLQSGALADKLDTVIELSIEELGVAIRDAIEEAQGVIAEAEAVDLPQGFGRD